MLVTLAIPPQSIPYSRLLRNAAPLAGWTAPGLGLGTGRKEKKEASNKPATGLQQAYNMPATTAALRQGQRVAPVALGGDDRVALAN